MIVIDLGDQGVGTREEHGLIGVDFVAYRIQVFDGDLGPVSVVIVQRGQNRFVRDEGDGGDGARISARDIDRSDGLTFEKQRGGTARFPMQNPIIYGKYRGI